MAQYVLAKLPIAVSHPGKIFWPEEGYTKLDLVEYYNAIFPHLSPYVKDRMLSLERCPDGMQGECFIQKQKPKGMPAGTPSKRIAHADNSGEFTDYVVGGSNAFTVKLVEASADSPSFRPSLPGLPSFTPHFTV
jgi:DNA primase